MATRKVGDAKCAEIRVAIAASLERAGPGSMIVMATEDEFGGRQRLGIVATVALKGDANEVVKLAPSDFHLVDSDDRLARGTASTCSPPGAAFPRGRYAKLIRRIEWISGVSTELTE